VAATSNVDLSVQPNEDQAPRCAHLLTLRRNMGSQRTMTDGTKRTSKPSSLHIATLRDPVATLVVCPRWCWSQFRRDARVHDRLVGASARFVVKASRRRVR
jgi:hypothetical protein